MIKVEIDVSSFRLLYEDLTPRRLAIAMRRAAKRLNEPLIELASRPTKGWSHEVEFTIKHNLRVRDDEASIEIHTDDEAYNWLDYGTLPHKISAKNAKRLHFLGDPNKVYQPKTMPSDLSPHELIYEGTDIYPAYVMHPGVEERLFGPEVIKQIEQTLDQIVTDELVAAWQRQKTYRPR